MADSVVGGLVSTGVVWSGVADGGLVMGSEGSVGAGDGGQSPGGAVTAGRDWLTRRADSEKTAAAVGSRGTGLRRVSRSSEVWSGVFSWFWSFLGSSAPSSPGSTCPEGGSCVGMGVGLAGVVAGLGE